MTTPPQGNKPTGLGRFSKTLAFWLLVILVPVAFLQFSGAKQGGTVVKIEYSEYDAQLKADNISKVTVVGGTEIHGEFVNAYAPTGARPAKRFTMLMPGPFSDRELQRLSDAGVKIGAQNARTSFGTFLIAALPWILMIGFWFFIMRQMQSNGQKAFSFGKSKAKLLSGDTPKVTFADVAGCDEAKYDLQEIIEFLKEPSKFTKLGGRLPKGALLVGQPGSGMKLLSMAVAGEGVRDFF